jgi:hypothetical protein
MKTKSIISIALLMGLAAGAGVAAKRNFVASANSKPAFTLHSQVTRVNPKDNSEIVSQEVRYVSSGGNSRTVHIEANGLVRESFFERGRGFFTVNAKDRLLYQNKNMSSAGVDAPLPTAEGLRLSPQFVRTDKILGYTTYVHRVMDEASGLPSSDAYFAPEFGNTPLKLVIYSGGQVVYVTEGVRVEWGEPNLTLLKGPSYPVAP